MKNFRFYSLILTFVLTVAVTGAEASTEIQWWNAMDGALGERSNYIVAGFNASQSEYVVKSVFKGSYTETMMAGIDAFRIGTPPHILQVANLGTPNMLATKDAVYPVYQLMADFDQPFDKSNYLSIIAGEYTTTDGKMLSLPFNSSTPVVFWNKDAFRKAGLDDAPRTWEEVGTTSREIIAAGGSECGFTIGWQSWTLLENYSAWNGLAFASKGNGFGGLDTELVFNGPEHVKHIQRVADWQKDNTFRYGGRRGDGNHLFSKGECAMLINSSAYYGSLKKAAKFDFGTSQLPLDHEVIDAPLNSIIGGASLWVLKGHSREEYAGVVKFLTYISDVFVQSFWHQNTGYVPITKAAYELSKDTGYYEQNEGRAVAIIQLSGKPTENSKGLRLGNLVQIREIINDELEAIWSGKKTAQQGLDDAVSGGNKLLRKFEKANR